MKAARPANYAGYFGLKYADPKHASSGTHYLIRKSAALVPLREQLLATLGYREVSETLKKNETGIFFGKQAKKFEPATAVPQQTQFGD